MTCSCPSCSAAQARRAETSARIRHFAVPLPCAKALQALDALVAAGRLSSVEADVLRDGIWPLVEVEQSGSPFHGPRLRPLLALAPGGLVAQPNGPFPPEGV